MKERKVYLDALRGIAILLMVVDHAADWWLTEAGRDTFVGKLHGPLGAMAAPLFFYLVGVGIALSDRRAAQAGRPRGAFARRQLWRGTRLFLWGYALNLVVYFTGSNFDDLWAVDVLHTIGLCIWCTLPLLWLPASTVAGIALGLAAGVAVLGQSAGEWVLPAWAAAFLTGTGGIGYFPLLLWLPYALLGLSTGRWIGTASRPARLMGILSATGLLAFVSTALVDPGWGYRHPRPIYLLFSIAVLCWLTAGLWLWTERGGHRGPLVHALRDLGQTSLLLYVYHHLVGYRLFWLLGWTKGRSWRGEYGVFSPLWTGVLLCVLLASMLFVARRWLVWQASRRASLTVASAILNLVRSLPP
jgi:uncharacterized membrane protein